jgi:hypothetical protein
MKTIFDKETSKEILNRINKLTPETQRKWGKMDVAQMMAHCYEGLLMVTGEKKMPRVFIGRLIGALMKPLVLSEKPFRRNSPTAPGLIIADAREFEKEKELLTAKIKSITSSGKTITTTHPHPFFGKMNPDEWGISVYKHLDHHLTQFGV